MRYLGAKTELVDRIYSLIKSLKLNNQNYTFCDAFAGTCAVGEYMKDKFRIIANDNQYYSYVISHAKLNTPDLTFPKLGLDPFEYFNQDNLFLKGFIYENYSPGGTAGRMYFSSENAGKIDFIRTKIEKWYQDGKISEDEYYYLIAALLESVSKVANVAGVYGAYLKKWDPRAVKPMKFIKVEQRDTGSLFRAEIHNRKLEDLINDVSGDILYLDPPYTATQYAGQYHILETIARYDDPIISGKGGLRNTAETTSSWCRRGEVNVAFEYIIAKANFKHIILSYNTDGLMSEKYIESVLKRYGKPETYKLIRIPYKKYINYHSTKDALNHCEFLFYIEKKEPETVSYASPLNYQGGKYDIIDFIKSNSPTHFSRFIEPFGGGYNVGINIEAEQIIYNEFNYKVTELIECFKNTETSDLVKYILRSIKRYKLAKNDKDAYIKLRSIYNALPPKRRDPKMLYLLVLYGFHQQLRFNSAHEFNNPVGNSSYNDQVAEKLVSFCRRIQEQNIVFMSDDFAKTLDYVSEDTFVYCDPPYLITLGSYNDGKRGFNGWGKSDELRLYDYLNKLDEMGVKFMLSNVLEHKGQTNELLKNWINEHNYHVIEYTGKGGRGRKEILVLHYKKEQND